MKIPWRRAETDLEREIAHHMYQLAAEYERRGHSREDALRLAKRDFGGSDQIKEKCRDERRWAWLNGWRQDLVFGARMMRRTPIVTAAAVLSLALGIGANTAIVSLMDVVLWRDLPLPNPKQLTLIHWQSHGFPRGLTEASRGSSLRVDGWQVSDFFSFPAFQAIRIGVSDRASVAAYRYPDRVSASYAGRPIVAHQRTVSGNFFSTLQVRVHAGRLLADTDDSYSAPAAAVLSYRFWERALGSDPDAIGRSININNEPYVIAGILEANFYGLFPGDPIEIYTSMHHGSWLQQGPRGRNPIDDDRFWGVSLIARRNADVTDAQLRPRWTRCFEPHGPRSRRTLLLPFRFVSTKGRADWDFSVANFATLSSF